MAQKEVVLKVAMSIPNEGLTKAEAYDNHLLHAQRMGGLEERWKLENKLHAYDKTVPFHPVRYEFYWFTCGRMLTQMARELLAENAVKSGMDYIIMYDDDMILPINFAELMLTQMQEHPEIDVLGALAFMRRQPHYPVLYTTIDGFDAVANTEYYIREFVKQYPKDTLVECDAVGFGGVCIKVDLLKKMGDTWFMSTTKTGEDIWFCHEAKRRGARIFMDTRIKLGHLSDPMVIDEDYFEKFVEESKHDLGNKHAYKYEPIPDAEIAKGLEAAK